jgi:hypothetical protein
MSVNRIMSAEARRFVSSSRRPQSPLTPGHVASLAGGSGPGHYQEGRRARLLGSWSCPPSSRQPTAPATT